MELLQIAIVLVQGEDRGMRGHNGAPSDHTTAGRIDRIDLVRATPQQQKSPA